MVSKLTKRPSGLKSLRLKVQLDLLVSFISYNCYNCLKVVKMGGGFKQNQNYTTTMK